MKTEYWCVFNYGVCTTICERHGTLSAAREAAKACEKGGGTSHRIFKVIEAKKKKK